MGKIAKVKTDGTLMLKGEVIEYPAELEGKRNLFSGEFYRDINNYDGVSLYRYHLTNLASNKRYAFRSWLKEGEVAESGFYLTLSIGHPNPNSVGSVGGVAGHIIQNGSMRNSSISPREDMPVYISYHRESTDPSVLDKYHISIQQLDSGNISEWTPAPEDLGLEYSSDIQNFTTGFKNNGDLFIDDIIEGKKGIRYIRDYLIGGSTSNAVNHWIEIKAFDSNGQNIALGKTVYNSAGQTPVALVDGDINTNQWTLAGMSGTFTWQEIDLGEIYDIKEITVWHYYEDGRTYHHTITDVSPDGVNWANIFDSDVSGTYPETSSGKTHIVPSINASINADGILYVNEIIEGVDL